MCLNGLYKGMVFYSYLQNNFSSGFNVTFVLLTFYL